MRISLFTALVVLSLVALARCAIKPIANDANWRSNLNALLPGDVGQLGNGDYMVNGGWTFTFNGGATTPIVVENAPGTSPRIVQSVTNKNIFDVQGSYFTLRGITFTISNGATGGRGINLLSGDHVVMENLKVLNIVENAISANLGGVTYTDLTFRNIEVGFTGGTGECFYLGCVADGCRVNTALIENCYCHDTCVPTACTGGSYGSGFQVKPGSNNVVVRNNVCYNTNGVCTLLYDDYDRGQNVIEGNLVIKVRSDNGIQATAGVVIRNNIVYDVANDGISMSSNSLMSGASPRNYVIYGNTVVKAAAFCLRTTTPTPASSVTVANNALLCDGSGSGAFSSASQAGVTWLKNAYFNGSPPPGVGAGGAFLVGASTTELANPAGYNFYPKTGSALIGSGTMFSAPYDFNALVRDPCNPTAGAYQYSTSTNPGYVYPANGGFKTLAGAQQCLSASCTIPPCSPATSPPPITTKPATTTLPPTTPPTTTTPAATTPAPVTTKPSTTAPPPATTTPSTTQPTTTTPGVTPPATTAPTATTPPPTTGPPATTPPASSGTTAPPTASGTTAPPSTATLPSTTEPPTSSPSGTVAPPTPAPSATATLAPATTAPRKSKCTITLTAVPGACIDSAAAQSAVSLQLGIPAADVTVARCVACAVPSLCTTLDLEVEGGDCNSVVYNAPSLNQTLGGTVQSAVSRSPKHKKPFPWYIPVAVVLGVLVLAAVAVIVYFIVKKATPAPGSRAQWATDFDELYAHPAGQI